MRMPTLKVGTARSGLAICIFTTEDQGYIQSQLQILSAADHFDAWAIFERLTVRELRRSGEMSDWVVKYQYYAKLHQSINSEEFMLSEMARLGLATSLDLVRFAAKLTEKIFLD